MMVHCLLHVIRTNCNNSMQTENVPSCPWSLHGCCGISLMFACGIRAIVDLVPLVISPIKVPYILSSISPLWEYSSYNTMAQAEATWRLMTKKSPSGGRFPRPLWGATHSAQAPWAPWRGKETLRDPRVFYWINGKE